MKRNKSLDLHYFLTIFLVHPVSQKPLLSSGNFKYLITKILVTGTSSNITFPPKSCHENLLKKDLFSVIEINA